MKSFIAAIVILVTSIVPSFGLSPQEKYEEAKKEYFDGKTEYSKIILLSLINTEEDIPDTTKGSVFTALGRISLEEGKYTEAIKYLNKANNAFLEANAEIHRGITYLNYGRLYFDIGEYDLAIEYYNRELEIAEKNNLNRRVAVALVNLGAVYYVKSQYKIAIDYYKSAIDIYPGNSGEELGTLLPNIALCYLQLNETDKAKKVIDSSIAHLSTQPNDYDLSFYMYVKGYYYNIVGKLDSAEYYCNNAIRLHNLGENHRYYADYNLMKAQIVAAQGKHHLADSLLSIAESIYRSIDDIEALSDIYSEWLALGEIDPDQTYSNKTEALVEYLLNVKPRLTAQKDSLRMIATTLEIDLITEKAEKEIIFRTTIMVVIIVVLVAVFILGIILHLKRIKSLELDNSNQIEDFYATKDMLFSMWDYITKAFTNYQSRLGDPPKELTDNLIAGKEHIDKVFAIIDKNIKSKKVKSSILKELKK
jgi:tetratricopeptide (TPR) repeat protein